MKNIKLLLLMFVSLAVISCKHGEYMPEVDTINVGVFTLDENSSVLIEGENFKTKFNVKLYYPNDKIEEARLVGIKNSDVSTLSILKDKIEVLPLDVELTFQELITSFKTIDVNDVIEVGLDIKVGNVWYPAFGFDGKSTATSNVLAIPGSNPVLTLKKVAPLNIDDFVGTLPLQDDAMGITSVEVQKVSDTELKIVNYGTGTEYGTSDIIVTINPKDYSATMPKQVIFPTFGAHTNLAYEGKGDVDSYNGIISLSLTVTVDQGSFGNGFKFIIGPKANP